MEKIPDNEEIRKRIWKNLPPNEKARYMKPCIREIEYETHSLLKYKFDVKGIEDVSLEGIEQIVQRTILQKFPFVKQFEKKSIYGTDKCNVMYDVGGLFVGLYSLRDETSKEEHTVVHINEQSAPKSYIRGYGFSLSIKNANSKEAATFTRELCKIFDIHIQAEQDEYLRFMEESNIGMPAKVLAKNKRKECILMELIRPNESERLAIGISRGRYLGRKISKSKLRSILHSPPRE